MSDHKLETRFDRSAMLKPVKTTQGFLRMDGNLTRIGVLPYTNPDGSLRRELRHPDEVFKSDSLATLAGAPVTDLHPSEMVSPMNVGKLGRGFVGEGVRQDGRFVRARLTVQDGGLIKAINGGSRRELSAGYQCWLDHQDGIFKGERFDAIQRGIIYNHVAVGPRGWGRAGGDVSLHMDSHTGGANLGAFVRQQLELMNKTVRDMAEELQIDEFALEAFLDGFWASLRPMDAVFLDGVRRQELDSIAKFIDQNTSTLFDMVPVAERIDGVPPKGKPKMDTTKITVDGIQYDVAETAAPHIVKAIKERDDKLEGVQAKLDAKQAEVDAANKERDDAKGRADAAEDPKKIEAAVNARTAVQTKATSIIGAEAKFDGKTDREIKVEALKKNDEKFDAAEKSDAYIDAAFDLLKVDEVRDDKKSRTIQTVVGGRNTNDGKDQPDPFDAEAARATMMQANQDAWQGPVGVSTIPAK